MQRRPQNIREVISNKDDVRAILRSEAMLADVELAVEMSSCTEEEMSDEFGLSAEQRKSF